MFFDNSRSKFEIKWINWFKQKQSCWCNYKGEFKWYKHLNIESNIYMLVTFSCSIQYVHFSGYKVIMNFCCPRSSCIMDFDILMCPFTVWGLYYVKMGENSMHWCTHIEFYIIFEHFIHITLPFTRPKVLFSHIHPSIPF